MEAVSGFLSPKSNKAEGGNSFDTKKRDELLSDIEEIENEREEIQVSEETESEEEEEEDK